MTNPIRLTEDMLKIFFLSRFCIQNKPGSIQKNLHKTICVMFKLVLLPFHTCSHRIKI